MDNLYIYINIYNIYIYIYIYNIYIHIQYHTDHPSRFSLEFSKCILPHQSTICVLRERERKLTIIMYVFPPPLALTRTLNLHQIAYMKQEATRSRHQSAQWNHHGYRFTVVTRKTPTRHRPYSCQLTTIHKRRKLYVTQCLSETRVTP